MGFFTMLHFKDARALGQILKYKKFAFLFSLKSIEIFDLNVDVK